MNQRVVRIGRAAIAVAAAGLVLAVVLAFVPVWPCSLIEHFRVQLLLGGIAVVAAAYRSRWFDAALIAWLIDFAIVAPDLSRSANSHDGIHVKLVFSNVLAPNPHHDRVAKLIADEQPDIVALAEADAKWFTALAPTLAGYERIEHPRSDFFGISLYVKGALRGKVEWLGTELPTIVAEVTLANGPRMSVIVTHPWPPMSSWAENEQHEQLAAIAERIATLPPPIVLVGDFNATPWSRPFAKLVGATGLCDTRAGFGYQGSYPSSSTILRIPIDHVLVSCSVGVRSREIGPDVGSDHLPIIVDLSF